MSQFSNQQHPRYVLERNWSHLSLSVQDEQLLTVYWVLYNIFLLHLSWNGKEESFFQSLKSGQPYHKFGCSHEANLVPCQKTSHTKCIGCKTSMVFLNVRGVSFLSWITHLTHPVWLLIKKAASLGKMAHFQYSHRQEFERKEF